MVRTLIRDRLGVLLLYEGGLLLSKSMSIKVDTCDHRFIGIPTMLLYYSADFREKCPSSRSAPAPLLRYIYNKVAPVIVYGYTTLRIPVLVRLPK